MGYDSSRGSAFSAGSTSNTGFASTRGSGFSSGSSSSAASRGSQVAAVKEAPTARPWKSKMALLMYPPGKPPPRRLLPSRPLPPLELLDPHLDHPTLDLLSDHPTPEPSALLQLPTEDHPALLAPAALLAALPASMNLL